MMGSQAADQPLMQEGLILIPMPTSSLPLPSSPCSPLGFTDTLWQALTDSYAAMPMGNTAEKLAQQVRTRLTSTWCALHGPPAVLTMTLTEHPHTPVSFPQPHCSTALPVRTRTNTPSAPNSPTRPHWQLASTRRR